MINLATVVVIGSLRSTRPRLLRAASNAAVKLATSSGSNTGPYSALRMSRIGTVNSSTARRRLEGSTIPHRSLGCGRRSCGTALEFLAGVGRFVERSAPIADSWARNRTRAGPYNLAPTNKCLAQTDKSCTGGETTKKREVAGACQHQRTNVWRKTTRPAQGAKRLRSGEVAGVL